MLNNQFNPIVMIIVCVISALCSGLLVAALCRYSKTLGLVAEVNQRSSHLQPTPTGGGLGFVFISWTMGVLLVLGCLLAQGCSLSFGSGMVESGELALLALLLLSMPLAIVGFFDDIYPVPAIWRFGLQLMLTLILVGWAWYFDSNTSVDAGLKASDKIYDLLPGFHTNQEVTVGLVIIVTALVTIFAGVWWINLFNFMDGIDGIAASQGIFILLSVGSLLAFNNQYSQDRFILVNFSVICSASLLGFLYFNWSPARIFMGDIGSLWLGFIILGLTVISVKFQWLRLEVWLILSAVFIVDASATLILRLMQGFSPFQAHRQHAYQCLSRYWQSHRKVVLAILGINVLFLLPLAYWANQPSDNLILSPFILLLAYIPLLIIYMKVKNLTAE